MTRISIADDEAERRGLLRRDLIEQSLAVRTEPDAVAAAHPLARGRVDVLVVDLDLMMPGEDGLSPCRRLRGQGETIPILMRTARGELFGRVLGLARGADDYLAETIALVPGLPQPRLADGPGWPEVRGRRPGFALARVDDLKRPFPRGDAARGGPAGLGLGQAIVERVARAEGAEPQLLPRIQWPA